MSYSQTFQFLQISQTEKITMPLHEKDNWVLCIFPLYNWSWPLINHLDFSKWFHAVMIDSTIFSSSRFFLFVSFLYYKNKTKGWRYMIGNFEKKIVLQTSDNLKLKSEWYFNINSDFDIFVLKMFFKLNCSTFIYWRFIYILIKKQVLVVQCFCIFILLE